MKQNLRIFFLSIFCVVAVLSRGYAAETKPKGFSAGVKTMLRSMSKSPTSVVRTNADTTHGESKIRAVYNTKNSADNWIVTVDLVHDYEKVEIAAYNILGRKVLDIASKDNYSKGQITKEFDSYNLPEGMYILVVQGQDLRLAEKFVVSR